MQTSFTYNAERVIGNGSFGVGYQVPQILYDMNSQARVAETGEIVAIKKVYQDKRYKNRELQIMKELFHPSVITMKHAFYTTGDKVCDLVLTVVA